MSDEYWIAGLAYSPLPGRASPRRRFIKSPFPPLISPAQSPPLPSPPMTPNSITPPPPGRPKSRAKGRRTPALGVHERQDVQMSLAMVISGNGGGGNSSPPGGASPPAGGSPGSGDMHAHGSSSPRSFAQRESQKDKRIMLRELLPRVLATPALESQPEDMARFARLQILALHIFQDPCAFDQDELGRFLAQPLALDALRTFSDIIIDSWTRAAPAAIRIPPLSPIRIVDPSSDLSDLDTTPLELCSAATCACLLWTNMHPERWLQVSKATRERGGGALDLSAEVENDDAKGLVGKTRSGMPVTLIRVRAPNVSADTSLRARIRVGLQPWQRVSHPTIVPLYGVKEDVDGLALVCSAAPREKLSSAMPSSALEAYRMMRQLAKALRYLHQQRPALVHGGIRPETVLVTSGGDVQLGESGLTKILEDCAAPGERTMPPGGLRYAAPELFGENKTLAKRTMRSDVYAFGCVLYEVFAGEPPFADIPEGRVPRTLYDGQILRRPPHPGQGLGIGVGDELWALIQRCCAFDLSRRPTMQQVVHQLTAARHMDAGLGAGIGGGVGAALEPSALMALVESASKIAVPVAVK